MIKLNKEFISGIVIGFGSGLAVKSFSGQDKLSWKKVVKGTLRTSLSAYDKVKDGLAKTKENFEDLTAEVRNEIQAEKEAKVTPEVEPITPAAAPEATLSVAGE